MSAVPLPSISSGPPGRPVPSVNPGGPDQPRMGFFTDTSVCIGCKACEVACKQWNEVPEDGIALTGMSYDNTIGLGASTWRHVAFIEQSAVVPRPAGDTGADPPGDDGDGDLRWLMSSDVCKHCTEAACLDVCPTGALMFKSEHDKRQDGTWDESRQTVTDTICPYCGVGCTLQLRVQDNEIVRVTSPLDHEVTSGHLCVKGRCGWQFVQNRPKE